MTESLTGKYYKNLFRKNPIIYLAIIGSILGGAISIYQFINISMITGSWYSWWWIPLSVLFIGPVGVIFFAIILPIIPWIIYIFFRILIEFN
jgi:hypothetical protein